MLSFAFLSRTSKKLCCARVRLTTNSSLHLLIITVSEGGPEGKAQIRLEFFWNIGALFEEARVVYRKRHGPAFRQGSPHSATLVKAKLHRSLKEKEEKDHSVTVLLFYLDTRSKDRREKKRENKQTESFIGFLFCSFFFVSSFFLSVIENQNDGQNALLPSLTC